MDPQGSKKPKKMPIPLPILGALISGGLSGLFKVGSTIAANKYNSPLAQKRRLRKAGLPQAYMYEGRVNQQSQIPDLDLDPDLGFGETALLDISQQKVDISAQDLARKMQELGIDLSKLDLDWKKYGIDLEKLGIAKEQLGISKGLLDIKRGQFGLQEKLTDEQLNKLRQEVRILTAGGDIKVGEAAWMSQEGADGLSNQERNLNLQQNIAKAELFLKTQQGELAEIQKKIDQTMMDQGLQVAEKRARIAALVSQAGNLAAGSKLMGQTFDVREFSQRTTEAIMNRVGDWEDIGGEFVGDIVTIITAYFLKSL